MLVYYLAYSNIQQYSLLLPPLYSDLHCTTLWYTANNLQMLYKATAKKARMCMAFIYHIIQAPTYHLFGHKSNPFTGLIVGVSDELKRGNS